MTYYFFTNFSCLLFAIVLSPIACLPNETSNQVTLCASDALSSGKAWDYCVDPIPMSRSWYRAMAECRSYGGELVSLEWPEKLRDIQTLLTEYRANYSNGLFVNAHKPFYSANNQFAWKSGETLEQIAEPTTNIMEQCAFIINSHFYAIACDKELMSIPLICQRDSRRIFVGPDSTTLLITMNEISHKQIKYQTETCEYLSFIRSNFNWYQSKIFCETINAELIGVPKKEECQLIVAPQFAGDLAVFLNVHLYLYSKNFSDFTYKDNADKSIDEFACSFTNNIIQKTNALCIELVRDTKTISSVECDSKSTRNPKGFICRQCRPKQYKPVSYIYNQPVSINQTSIINSGISPNIFILTICAMLVVSILVCFALFILLYCAKKNHKRAYVQAEITEPNEAPLHVSPPASPTRVSLRKLSTTEAETQTCESETAEQQKPAENEDVTAAVPPVLATDPPVLAQLLCNTPINEPHCSGT